MDQGVRQVRPKNPREKASIFSIVTFFYNFSLFKKGRAKNLDDEDVYEVVPRYSSEKLGSDLENHWHMECKKRKNPSVMRVLICRYGLTYFCVGILQLCVKTFIVVVQPWAMGKLTGYFKENQTETTRTDAYKYAAMLIGLNMFTIMYNHNYTQYVVEYGMLIRTAFSALIYRKAVRLRPSAFSDITMGNIVTLITKDVFAFEGALLFLNDVWIGLIHTVVITYLIYTRVGASVFAGIGFFLMIIPLQVFVARKTSFLRLKSAKKTDERLQIIKEALSAIKIIKMYTWEKCFEKIITEYREKEVKSLAVIFYLKAIILIMGLLVSKLSFYIIVMTFMWTGHYIEAEVIYYMQACFVPLGNYIITSIPLGISQSAEVFASAKRIGTFLTTEELKEGQQSATVPHPKIYLRNVTAVVNNVPVLQDVSLFINKGLLLVTGNVGSGKSSLLKTILKDYPTTNGQILVEGTLSYASEEPWLFPSTIRQNILFGQPYNEKRYQEVLNVCALTLDLNHFEHGDQTIVGDRGVNLSKGQQSRINLARAVYKDSDIYLLDDCLSALDLHVSKYVFKRCIKEFLKDKIVILVTHNVNHIKDVYGKNVLFIENGTTLSIEQQKQTLDKRITYYIDDVDFDYFAGETEQDETEKERVEKSELNEYTVDDSVPLLANDHNEKPVKNLYHEDKKSGKVSLGVYFRYYKYTGGFLVLLLVLTLFIVGQGAIMYTDNILRLWVNLEPNVTKHIKSNLTNTTEFDAVLKKRNWIINLYSVFTVTAVITVFITAYFNFYFCLKGSRNLHKAITSTVLNTYMYFFDNHFIGNIVNRFSKDLAVVDEVIPKVIYDNLRNILLFFGRIFLIVYVNTLFLIHSTVLIIVLYVIRRFYIPTGRAIKRLESATRSPMIGYLNSTLEGLTTIRAYEKQYLLISEFDKHQDLYTSSSFMMVCSSRAFAFVLDMVCSVFLAAIILKFLFFGSGTQAGDFGMVVIQAMMLSGHVQWTIRQITELENNMTSVERVLEYTDIDTEDKESGEIRANWPSEGRIEYREVSLTYKTTNEQVLKKISFVIEPRQKIGIVGRTGAGKSSLISTLFRLYDFEGKILIDGVDTQTVSLNSLRSQIAIIPQDPILFTGTIRSNIDPIDKYSDSLVWEAIEKVNLKHAITSLQEEINEGGTNYSSGQRQLICLARALVSKNKIIVLDEATANMDPETCTLLQKTMRDNFADCVIITIAHRMNTVADSDKVMVVSEGRIVEFDTPEALLENTDGFFYSLIKHSGLLET